MKYIFKALMFLWMLTYFLTFLQAYDQHDICQFKKVIQNGWNDTNQSLNQKIIDLGRTEIPKIINNLQYPLKPDENISNKPPFPKFILHQGDYIKLFAYSKYLESQNKIDNVIQLYIHAYQGLNNIKMSSYIPLIYLIALNKTLNKSLNSSLEHHVFTKKEKRLLYEKLSSVLILDTQKLIKTIKAEKSLTLYFVKTANKVDGNYAIDKQHLKIFKRQWKEAANTYYTDFINAIKNNTIEKFIEEKKHSRESISIATHLKMKLLELKLKLFNKLSIPIDHSDYVTLSSYRINQDLYMSTKAIDDTIRDYLKVQKDNQKLLQKLKEES